jgi:transcriptional regulator with XRE-family HTH domain
MDPDADRSAWTILTGGVVVSKIPAVARYVRSTLRCTPVDRHHQLAQFLRARRARVRPEDVGLPGIDRRRAPGLRREEVAMLAGISAGYYMRLEQGRDHRPSEQVLEALAQALRLDDDATAHLFSLGRPAPPTTQSRLAGDESVPSDLQDLLDSWTTTPAFIHNRRLDVLASTALARALTPLSEPGTNLMRSWFLDHEDRKRYDDIEFVLTQAVAYFRATVGSHPDDPDVQNLVDELSLASEEFRQIWARHDVQPGLLGEGPVYHHPTMGAVRLRYRTFAVTGTEGFTMWVVSAAPGSRDAQALALLSTMVADHDTPISKQATRRSRRSTRSGRSVPPRGSSRSSPA